MPKHLTYDGPHPEVDVIEEGVCVLEGVIRGKTVEVPDATAARLLEQSTWSEAKSAPPKTPKQGA